MRCVKSVPRRLIIIIAIRCFLSTLAAAIFSCARICPFFLFLPISFWELWNKEKLFISHESLFEMLLCRLAHAFLPFSPRIYLSFDSGLFGSI